MRRTDVVLTDRWPLRFVRVYRSNDTVQRPFGLGMSHNYELLLSGGDTTTYSYVDLILPDGALLHYPRISSGTAYANAVFEHTTTTTKYYKSRIAWNGNG